MNYIGKSYNKLFLFEGKDRQQQAKAKTKKIITDYFKNIDVSQPNEHTQGLSLVDFLEKEIINTWFHEPDMHSAKNFFIKLEPMVATIALNAGWQPDRDNNETLNSLSAIIGHLWNQYSAKRISDEEILNIASFTNIEQLEDLYSDAVSQNLYDRQEKSATRGSGVLNASYEIIEDLTFEQANKIGNYSLSGGKLCYTQDKNTWENYKNHGLNKCYCLLRKDWRQVPEEHGEVVFKPEDYGGYTAYDSYGMSMIFFFVSPEDVITKSNTRWNHNATYPHGVDNAFDEDDIRELMGFGIKEKFPGYTVDELKAKGIKYISFKNAQSLLDQGVSPEDIFDEIHKFEGYSIVKLNKEENYLSPDNKLLSRIGFDVVYEFSGGFARVQLSGKYSYINQRGKLIENGNIWFNNAYDFSEGLGRVKLDGKGYSFINPSGELIGNGKIWFDTAYDFSEGFARVYLEGKGVSFINQRGELIDNGNLWIDEAYDFSHGFGIVYLDDKGYSYINQNGVLIGNGKLWFNNAYNFREGFGLVELDGKGFSFINQSGDLIGNGKLWFGYAYDFSEGFARVYLEGKPYLLRQDMVLCDLETKKPIRQLTNESFKVLSLMHRMRLM